MIRLVSTAEDLPNLPDRIGTLYYDLETSGFSPYTGSEIVGHAFTFDGCPDAWYIPVRHEPDSGTLFDTMRHVGPAAALGFMREALRRSDLWVNHNIKFDTHFYATELLNLTGETFDPPRGFMVDTLPLAKLVDAYSQVGGYDLKTLAKRWCNRSTRSEEVLKDHLAEARRIFGKKAHYGHLSPGLMTDYAGEDPLHNRAVWEEIQRRRYEGDDRVWALERDLPGVLFAMERRGVLVDRDRMRDLRRDAEASLAEIGQRLADIDLTLDGHDLGSLECVRTRITRSFDLPPLRVTDKGAVSIDAAAIAEYMGMVQPESKAGRYLACLTDYREATQFLGLYAKGWEEHIGTDGRLHPSFNQAVRTGRMSCKSPNLQQLNKKAKTTLIPGEGRAFLSRDYAQVEYRIISSFVNDARIIQAYREDPDTDYHTLIAEIVGCDRRPAKTVNFGIAFGMGEAGLERALTLIMGNGSEAATILRKVHRENPRLRPTSKRAERFAYRYGYIRTAYGRRRHLKGFERKAFNTSVQGTAADLAKEALVAVEYSERLRELDASPVLLVHDEIVLNVPEDLGCIGEADGILSEIMASPSVPLRVPLTSDGGYSADAWAFAG